MTKKVEIKANILKNFIENAPFDGWNENNIASTIKAEGLEEGYAEVLFPEGIRSLNNDIAKQCASLVNKQIKGLNLKGLRVPEKVEKLCHLKILTYHEIFGGNKEALKKYFASSLNPNNTLNSFKYIFEFSSDVWNFLGDKSTDFSYYTKRLSLSKIYSEAALYSLSDESEGLELTAQFLKRTIDGLMKFHRLKQKFLDIIPSNRIFKRKRA